MKAVAFDRIAGEPCLRPPRLSLIADSALVMPRHPLFIPDFADAWSARIFVAFRMSRLGKTVARRFAPRYYDAVTLALRLIPVGDPDAYSGLFDGCLTLGVWQPLPDSGSLAIAAGGLDTTLTLADIDIDGAVALVSDVATVKMGDIIMPCHLPVDIPASPGMNITATIGGAPALAVRIK